MNYNRILPALAEMLEKPLRVAAFCRTAPEDDTNWLQERHYRTLIEHYPIWTFVGCYGGRCAKQTEHCLGGLHQMLAACKAGEIDLIIAKSASTIERNVVDCLRIVHELKELQPPIGVYFEDTDLYTLTVMWDICLNAILKMAEQESNNKGNIIECRTSYNENIPPSDS
jgi:DNA invertase Pin-like site-specific DNA recombinase